MSFEIKVPIDKAEAEINSLLDKKKILPKQRARLEPAIEAVAEAISLGLVVIHDDGQITQTLLTPVGELTELKYSARVEPLTINKHISTLKIDNQTNRNLVYLKSYTGQLEATFNRLENADRNIADSIAFFFQ